MREREGFCFNFLISLTKGSETAGPDSSEIRKARLSIVVSNTQSLPRHDLILDRWTTGRPAGGGNRNPAMVGIDVGHGTSLDVHVSCGRRRVDYLPFVPAPVLSK